MPEETPHNEANSRLPLAICIAFLEMIDDNNLTMQWHNFIVYNKLIYQISCTFGSIDITFPDGRIVSLFDAISN
jgi:hypothetical protein